MSQRKSCPSCGTDLSDGDPPESATDTDDEIRRLYRNGLSKEAVAERMNMPTEVVEAWIEREEREAAEPEQSESSEGSGHSQEAEDGIGEHWSDAAVFKCSGCKEAVAQENADSHECAETDWGQLS